jgi:uncharacterized membrane protein YfcA
MPLATHFFFLSFVALATFTQNLTGFAFGLVLLGLVGIFQLVPMADAANACSILILINAWVYFRQQPLRSVQPMVWPTMAGGMVGVLGGVLLLTWLASNAIEWLRLLLGGVIVMCSFLLLVHAKPIAALSQRSSFLFYGGLSGVMSGLFSSGGPPIVFHFYRQPLGREVVKQSLLVLFAANSAMRLGILAVSGHFAMNAFWLGLEALPVVYFITRWTARHPPDVSPRTVRRVVSLLLLIAGATLMGSVLLRMMQQPAADNYSSLAPEASTAFFHDASSRSICSPKALGVDPTVS